MAQDAPALDAVARAERKGRRNRAEPFRGAKRPCIQFSRQAPPRAEGRVVRACKSAGAACRSGRARVLAITAAVALPSRSAATAPVRVALPPVADQGAVIRRMSSRSAAARGRHRRQRASPAGSAPDMSQSLLAAGVPERQGREYVAVAGPRDRPCRRAQRRRPLRPGGRAARPTASSRGCSMPASTASPGPTSSY